MKTARSRHLLSGAMIGLTYLAAILATLPLVLILAHLIAKGASPLSLAFFTHMPRPVGESGGGMANAIVGTLILIGVASLIGLPIGIGAGLHLAEKRTTPLAYTVRFLSDVLNGLPSIVIGISAWEFLVRPIGHFSALAGGVALGTMMIPLVTRTTEEMLLVVPTSLREAALALGYPKWRLRRVRWWQWPGLRARRLRYSLPRLVINSGRRRCASRSPRYHFRSSPTQPARTTSGTGWRGQGRSS